MGDAKVTNSCMSALESPVSGWELVEDRELQLTHKSLQEASAESGQQGCIISLGF